MNSDQFSKRATPSVSGHQPAKNRRVPLKLPKRRPTFHQKQMQFLTIFFGAIAIFIVIAILWLLNMGIKPVF